MNTKTKTIPEKQALSPRQLAEQDTALWAKLKQQEAELKQQLADVTARLHNYAADHRADFGNSNTLRLGDAKLVFYNQGKLVQEEEFEMATFEATYPECVKKELSLSTVKGLMVNDDVKTDIEAYGLHLITTELFKVEKA